MTLTKEQAALIRCRHVYANGDICWGTKDQHGGIGHEHAFVASAVAERMPDTGEPCQRGCIRYHAPGCRPL